MTSPAAKPETSLTPRTDALADSFRTDAIARKEWHKLRSLCGTLEKENAALRSRMAEYEAGMDSWRQAAFNARASLDRAAKALRAFVDAEAEFRDTMQDIGGYDDPLADAYTEARACLAAISQTEG